MPSARAISASSSRSGKKIIITTVQKFPFIPDEIGNEQRGRQVRHHHRRGALEPGRQDPAAMSRRSPRRAPRKKTRLPRTRSTASMESRKMLPNASYFAFTATPKNKTLEIFGEPDPQADGTSSTGLSTATR